MTSFAICYDLNRPGQDYSTLIAAIKELGRWWHYLDSTWIVKSSRSATEIRDALRPYLDSNDELLILKLTGVAAWTGFDAKASQWLKDNL